MDCSWKHRCPEAFVKIKINCVDISRKFLTWVRQFLNSTGILVPVTINHATTCHETCHVSRVRVTSSRCGGWRPTGVCRVWRGGVLERQLAHWGQGSLGLGMDLELGSDSILDTRPTPGPAQPPSSNTFKWILLLVTSLSIGWCFYLDLLIR